MGNEAVQVNYELFGEVVGSKSGKMPLMQSPLPGISVVILKLLDGDLITEKGHVYRIELKRSDNILSAEFDVVPPHSVE